VTQFGYEAAFAKKPPNNMKGIIKIGATNEAVSALVKMLDKQ
jgi:hypothetical protein